MSDETKQSEITQREAKDITEYVAGEAALTPQAGTPKVTPEVAERVSGVIRKLAGMPQETK